MTGTAITEAEEFSKIYGLETLVIPTNLPIQRKDHNDLVYKSIYGKFQAVTKKVKELQEKGQPCLVGTISVEKSELLAKMFQQAGIKHQVLNAKHHEKEAEIVASAGSKGNVTIATNMAGRGTDIKINDEVKAVGGLFIIGTERHESRRIDNQLRGRSGRQGDPGASQFYVSMEDEIMRLFGGDRMKTIMETLKVPEDMPIENRIISRSIESAQKRVEGRNFDVRKHLVEYDDVMNKHRTIVYSRRRKILENENIHETIVDLIKTSSGDMVRGSTQMKHPENWLLEELAENLHTMTGLNPRDYKEKVLNAKKEDELQEYVTYLMVDAFMDKKESFGEDETFLDIEHQVYLRTIDRLWMEHIDAMMRLREQVSFRGYAQKDPLVEYKNDGFSMFEKLIDNIQNNTVQTLLRMDLKAQVHRHEVKKVSTNDEEISDIETGDRELIPTHNTPTGRPIVISADDVSDHDPAIHQEIYGMANPTSDPANVIRVGAEQSDSGVTVTQVEPEKSYPKVGRNDPCPCDSGKKYKKCHGA